MDNHQNPLSLRNIIAGMIIIVIGGIILAYIIQDARFASSRVTTQPSTLTEAPNNFINPTEVFTQTPIPPTNTSEPTSTPAPTQLPTELIDAFGIPMRLVPAGDFIMGSDIFDDEQPIHQVDLSAFYIDKFEVTNMLYEACVNAGVCQPPKQTNSYAHSSYFGNPEYDNYPVINVDWSMAKTYCEWRSAHLPTEAEWEKAARGTDGRIYPWGEEIKCTRLNYRSGESYCVGDISMVGSYESGISPYGVYDMAGNVWEWVADWYDENYYTTLGENAHNPQGPPNGSVHVVRGGSWYNYANGARSSMRNNGFDSSAIRNDLGFRCALTP